MLHVMNNSLKPSVPEIPRRGSWSTVAEVLSLDRYQISVAIALAVCIPMIVRGWLRGLDLTQPVQYNTVSATVIAILLGYISFRKIHVFPGITSGGYIATSLTLWFGLMSAVFVFFRLEYTTVQLFFGYTISLFY